MLPKSDDLEDLYARAKKLCAELGRLGNAEVTRPRLKDELADLSRTWLRYSPAIREAACCKAEVVSVLDDLMSGLLPVQAQRSRASTLKNRLQPFVDAVVEGVLVPVIQVEGSPRQVAARQV